MKSLAQRIAELTPQQRALYAKRRQQLERQKPQRPSIPKRTGSGPWPASTDQTALWFFHKLDPRTTAYNIPTATGLSGPVSLPLLQRSLTRLIRRHEILRTCLQEMDGVPYQIIEPALIIPIALVDLSQVDQQGSSAQADRNPLVNRIATSYTQAPFQLDRAPLFRMMLIRLAPQEHVLLAVLHHSVTDWWSYQIFYRDLFGFYQALCEGGADGLPQLPVQFADYAAWRDEWLRSQAFQDQLSYWLGNLKGAPAVLELPADRPRPPLQSQRGARVFFELPERATRRLRAIDRRSRASTFMTLLAASYVFIGRCTGRNDILMGTPASADRELPETVHLIGYLLNTLLLRGDLSGDPTFLELVGRVRKTVLGAFANKEMPFRRLVEEMDLERDLSRMPLYQVEFVYVNSEGTAQGFTQRRTGAQEQEEGKVAGLIRSGFTIERGTSPVDLQIAFTESYSEITFFLEYNTDIFEWHTIRRLGLQLTGCIGALAAESERPVSQICWLSKAHLHQLLVEWNDTRMPQPVAELLHVRFEAQAQQTPDSVALAADDRRLSYQQLNRHSRSLAVRLIQLGAGPEAFVGLCAGRSLQMVTALVGILESGAAYLPLDPQYPRQRLGFMLSDCQAALLIAEAEQLTDHSADTILLDTLLEPVSGSFSRNASQPAICGANLAYLLYTSGSTGRPKGVAVTHRSPCALLDWAQGVFADDQLSGVLASTSICFDLSVFEIFVPLSRGGTVLLAENALQLSALPSASQVSLINTVPSAMTELLELKALPLSAATINLAGEPLTQRLATWLDQLGSVKSVYNLYGPSEDTTYSTFSRISAQESRSPTIGRPIGGTQAYLLDRHLRPVPLGAAGELHLGGRGLARGYQTRPGLTAESFIPNPFDSAPGARIYRTGDLARQLPDGHLDFLGRRDHQVKLRGYRIELGEIEAAIQSQPDMSQAAVVVHSERLVAFVVGKRKEGRNRRERRGRAQRGAEKSSPRSLCLLSASSAVQSQDLRTHLQARLPEYMIPAQFVFLEEMPCTPNGKIDRRTLESLHIGNQQPQANFVPPRTPSEEVLAGIWEEILGSPSPGIYDSFFELGGHSLMAARMVSRIRRLFGVEPPMRQVFDAPRLAQLASWIDLAKQSESLAGAPPIVHLPGNDNLPLSFAQQRLWFLDQLLGPSATYNIPSAWSLQGDLDVPALQASLNALATRHESLRTSFPEVEGHPVQQIHPAQPVPLPIIDLQSLPQERRHLEARCLAHQEARRPFDLTQGPLFRAALVSLGRGGFRAKSAKPQGEIASAASSLQPTAYSLLLTLHHIITDGWSMGILQRDLAACYRFCSNCEPRTANCELPPLPLRYADYAAWQSDYLRGPVLQERLDFWKSHLEGAPPLLQLPFDRPRPEVQTFAGGIEQFSLGQDLTRRLKDLSRKNGATLFMTLLSGYGALLARYSGQEDLVVGFPVANRSQAEIEGLIGLFVNTLPLRLHASGKRGFRELLEEVRRNCLEALARQDLPFEKLVEELQPQRNLSAAPLFQVMLVLQNAPQQAEQMPGLTMTPLQIETGTAKFDLTLLLQEGPQGLYGVWEFNRDLFDPSTVHRMAQHWHRLLQEVASHPDQRLAAVGLLSDSEVRQLSVQWNGAAVPFDEESCLQEPFQAKARRTPGATSLIFGDRFLSYGELNARANRIAHQLIARGASAELRIGVCVERSLEMVIGLLAALKSGGAYVPIDPRWPLQRIGFMASDIQAACLLTNSQTAPLLAGFDTPVLLLDGPQAGNQQDPPRRAEADNTAYIIFTSGSTGQPKGVVLQHRPVLNLIEWVNRSFEVVPSDRLLAVASMCFDLSVYDIFGMLAAGGSIQLAADDEVGDPDRLAALLDEGQVTFWDSAPAALQQVVPFLPQPGKGSRALRLAFLSGDWIPLTLPTALSQVFANLRVIALGGATEAAIWSNFHPVEQVRPEWASIPYGRAIQNALYYVLDAELQPCPMGVAGDLCIGGRCLSLGYFNRPRLTAEQYIPDPFNKASRLYRTGDRARWRPQGYIEFLGRQDNQVKIRGYRVELGEIEAVMCRHPEVAQSAVVLREGRLVGYVVGSEEGGGERGEGRNRRGRRGRAQRGAEKSSPRSSRLPSASSAVQSPSLRSHLQACLPDYMIPSLILRLDSLPLTSSGKVDRRSLPDPVLPVQTSAESSLPRTPTQEVLAGLWAEILNLERVGLEDDFFELGGHSLLATQLVSRIRSLFNIEIPVRSVFESPTLSDLATAIEVALQGGLSPAQPITRVDRDRDLPLSFAQQRLWFLDRLEGAGAAYNIPAAVQLEGILDVSALQASLSAIIQRHETLRTSFPEREGIPVQKIHPPASFSLRVVDLHALPEFKRRAEALHLARQEALKAFDLANGPLLRATLVVLKSTGARPGFHRQDACATLEEPTPTLQSDTGILPVPPPSASPSELPTDNCQLTTVLLLTLHHIISDGWSMGVLIRELTAFYRAATVARVQSPKPKVQSRSEPGTRNLEPGTFSLSDLGPWTLDLRPLQIQYADFAHWQRRWLQGESQQAQTSYWQQQLEGLPALLDLPTDRPRPAMQTFQGRSCYFSMDSDLTQRLKALGRREGTTLFMTLLAAFAALLARYSSQDDVAIGSPIANRTRSEIEGLIGFFANTLVLRSRISSRMTFRQLLAQVRQTALQAYAHQDLPFEQLVDLLQPERNLSHSPLFQVMLVMQNAPLPTLDLPGLTLRPVAPTSLTAKFDLTLTVEETGQGLATAWEYNSGLFDRPSLTRMAEHWRILLEAMASQVDQSASSVVLLTPHEHRQVLVEWNATEVDFPGIGSVAGLFEKQSDRKPQSVAAIFEDHHLSYAALESRANQLAHHLRTLGAGPETLLAICLDRGLQMPVSLLAVLKAGAAYLPLDPAYPAERLSFMLSDSGASMLIAAAGTRPAKLPDKTSWVCPPTDQHRISRRSAQRPDRIHSPQNPAYVLYTSGSTGRPKGICMPEAALANLLAWQREFSTTRPAPRMLQFASLSFDVSFQEIFSAWQSGGTLVLISEASRRDMTQLARLIRRQAVDRLFVPFVALQYLAEAESSQFAVGSSQSRDGTHSQQSATSDTKAYSLKPKAFPAPRLPLREVLTAGEQLQITPAIIELFQRAAGCRLHNQYGPSETHVVTAQELEGAPSGWPALPAIGRPIANTRVYILDTSLNPLPVGIPGEVFIGGRALARGYQRRPSLTAERFIPDPWSGQSGQRLYCTGDRARLLPNGDIAFWGRCDDQVKIRGFRVEPGEVEAVLVRHPDVAQAAVAVREGRLVGYVVGGEGEERKEGGLGSNRRGRREKTQRGAEKSFLPTPRPASASSAVSPSALRRFLAEQLPDYMVPATIVQIDSLPLTPSGKVNRRALPDPAPAQLAQTEGIVLPRDWVEMRLLRIWEELLQVRSLSVTDNFFRAGGHSLLAVRLMDRINRTFESRLPLTLLFKRGTVEGLAEVLRRQAPQQPWSPLVAIQPQGSRPPLFCVHPGGGHVLCYADLAQELGPQQPFFGLQCSGLEEGQEPLESVEEMAALYLKSVQELWPGPYLLAGWSFGGLVAFEMALQLQNQGIHAAFLGLIDAFPKEAFPEGADRFEDDAELYTRVLEGVLPLQVEELRRLSPNEQLTHVVEQMRQHSLLPSDTRISQLRRLVRVFKRNMVMGHRPRRYEGDLTLFHARTHQAADMSCLLKAWNPYVGGKVRTHQIPGQHRNLVSPPHVSTLAKILQHCLNEVSRTGAEAQLRREVAS